MKIIKISKGKQVIVDDEDYNKLTKNKWSFSAYAVRAVYLGNQNGKPKYQKVFMHKYIMGTNKKVDHKNGDKLDNRKENLRMVTSTQNNQNRIKRTRSASIYKGVHLKRNKLSFSWRAIIKANNVEYLLGHFKEERHAAMARDIWARELHGEYANYNFPNAIFSH